MYTFILPSFPQREKWAHSMLFWWFYFLKYIDCYIFKLEQAQSTGSWRYVLSKLGTCNIFHVTYIQPYTCTCKGKFPWSSQSMQTKSNSMQLKTNHFPLLVWIGRSQGPKEFWFINYLKLSPLIQGRRWKKEAGICMAVTPGVSTENATVFCIIRHALRKNSQTFWRTHCQCSVFLVNHRTSLKRNFSWQNRETQCNS